MAVLSAADDPHAGQRCREQFGLNDCDLSVDHCEDVQLTAASKGQVLCCVCKYFGMSPVPSVPISTNSTAAASLQAAQGFPQKSKIPRACPVESHVCPLQKS